MEYGLIGEHLSHSYSKKIHAAIADYKYELREIKKEELPEFMKLRDFKGINVTIPYKEEVFKYLDEIDENAKKIGAVNTVVNRNGRLYGYNTDYLGMIDCLNKKGINLSGKKVLILGSGGTSKTAKHVAEVLSAGEAYRVSRSGRDNCITYEEAYEKHSDAEIIINTTPVGMYPNDGTGLCPVDLSAFKNLSGVFDVIFHPLRTELVTEAEKTGVPAVGGLYMLASQAVYAKAHFLGEDASDADKEKAYKSVLTDIRNIVLIGMPSSGKTTIGTALAEKLKKQYADTDAIITERIGCSIAEFFAEKGEAEFRKTETEVISELKEGKGLVISTGGGAVLKPENVAALKKNGYLIWLDRSLENLQATEDRPLSKDTEKLKKVYNERYEIYKNAADIRIPADGTASEVLKLAAERIGLI